MIYKRLFILASFCLSFSYLSAQVIDDAKAKEIKIIATGFLGLLEKYSSCKGAGYLSLQAQIIEMHDSYDTRDIMYNDLFAPNITAENEKIYDWQKYMDKLKYEFKNNVHVTYNYEKMLVLRDCITADPVTNNQYAYVKIDKTLEFENQKKSYTALISVNLSNGNKIAEVSTPDLYLGNCDLSNQNNEKNNRANELIVLRSLADDYFIKKDYISAKKYYTALKLEETNDSAISEKIAECDQMITITNLLDQAQLYYNAENYEAAIDIYTIILSKEGVEKQNIKNKIAICNTAIKEKNYKQAIGFGDYYMSIGRYETARQHFEKALTLKPGDPYCLTEIEKAKKHDYSFIKDEIKRAEGLTKEKKYPAAFKILSEYELSGLLSTDNYYFLTIMMFKAKGDVRKLMSYSKKDCDTYMCVYVLKMKRKLETETDQATIEDCKFLYEEVIISKFQN